MSQRWASELELKIGAKPIMTQKQEIRKQALLRRDALSVEQRAKASEDLARLDLLQFGDHLGDIFGKIIGAYWAIGSEIDPQPLLQVLVDQGAKLALPAVISKTQIEFRAYQLGQDLSDGGFGTKAPAKGAPILTPDILLMPLAAIDISGNRIGYGAGHYDRYIAQQSEQLVPAKRPKLIGLAFECQIFDNIRAEAHDQKLDGVMTPSQLFWCK